MKIVVNYPTPSNMGIQAVWLFKYITFAKHVEEVNVFLGDGLVQILKEDEDPSLINSRANLYRYKQQAYSPFKYIFNSLYRNLIALCNIRKYRISNFDVVYSPSSQLEFLILPYLIKLLNPKILITAVFDNEVSLGVNGVDARRVAAYIFYRISLLLLKRFDIIFTIDDQLKQNLINFGFAASKISVGGNGIEEYYLKKASVDNQIYSSDVLYMGRLNKKKGIHDLLHVLRDIKYADEHFKAIIMGSGESVVTGWIETFLKNNHLKENVTLVGHISGVEKYNYLLNADSFVFLSYDESFGVALLEALICGCKVYAYDLPAYRRHFSNFEINKYAIGEYKAVANDILNGRDINGKCKTINKDLVEAYSWESIAFKELQAIKKLQSTGPCFVNSTKDGF